MSQQVGCYCLFFNVCSNTRNFICLKIVEIFCLKQKSNIFLFHPGCSITPPALPSSKISCFVGSTCTSVFCCLEDDVTTRSYQLSLDVDTCAEKMIIKLEKMSYTVSLFDYQMGTKGTAKLFGVLVVELVKITYPGEKTNTFC